VRGENAIIVVPGACFELRPVEIEGARSAIEGADVFVTQLELSLPAVEAGLVLARSLGVRTILNPAPACALSDGILKSCDYLVPNESEAQVLTGIEIVSFEDAELAAKLLLERGVQNVVLTLGSRGALVVNEMMCERVSALDAGAVVETTGAGDAFCGGFATALAEGKGVVEAARFGCAVAGISVTRHGTAPSMPFRREVDALLER